MNTDDKTAVFDFDGETLDIMKHKTLKDVQGSSDQKNVESLKNTLLDLSTGKQKEKLHDRGYVIAIDGWWGAGKSTTTWATINEMKNANKDENRFIVVDKSFLPFGNINESISGFLKDLSETLIDKNILNISKEIKQFILESTSADENVNASINLGPIVLSRQIIFGKYNNKNIDNLIKKFSTLDKKNKTILLVIDDLDRLKPEEIVTVLRMIEKLRALPNLIILLPINKDVITRAINGSLLIESSASAETFLRKQIDRSVFIDNKYRELKSAFRDTYEKLPADSLMKNTKYDIEWGIKDGQPYGEKIKLVDLIWSLFAHIFIVRSALNDSENNNINNSKSQYLTKLRGMFDSTRPSSNDNGVENVFPVYYRNAWVPIGSAYSTSMSIMLNKLAEPSSSGSVVVLDESFINDVRNTGRVTYDVKTRDKTEEKNKIPIFIELFMKQLDDLDKDQSLPSRNEPMMSNFLKRRDVKLLASNLFARLNEELGKIFALERRKEDIIMDLFNIVSEEVERL